MPLSLVPDPQVAQIGVHLGRARIDVAACFLHHMQWVTLLHHLRAAWVASLMYDVAWLALLVHQHGPLACPPPLVLHRIIPDARAPVRA